MGDTLRKRCAVAWDRVRELDRPKYWARDEWREPFQCVTGAMIYLGNALTALSSEDLHRLLKPQAEENVKGILACDELPEFGARRTLGIDFALMHLASASLRLPAAVWLL